MTQARLNSLSILNFHKWQTVQVDVADVENDFGSKKTIDQKILGSILHLTRQYRNENAWIQVCSVWEGWLSIIYSKIGQF